MSRIEEALERAMRIKDAEPGPGPAAEAAAMPGPYGREKPSKVRMDRSGYPVRHLDPGRVQVRNPALVAITDPGSPVAEEYRKLKEMVLKSTRSGNGFRNTLMVTSALAGEGKTVTSLNLAACMAQEYDHTVLVVDADLRKPSCAKYLGIEPGPGLTDCLLKSTPVAEALIHTGIGKLAFLPAGTPVDNPAELFSSQRMKDLLMEMKHRYPDRYIIIDTPPVLPFAETRTIGSIADGVLLVVKEGVPSQEEIRESVDALRGATILGIVYNQAELSTLGNHYSSYYYSRYRR
jgi:protein-tyrosine kinase